jgi:endonuclease/exonuclease/phosphatase family metal-dependent hydrolase
MKPVKLLALFVLVCATSFAARADDAKVSVLSYNVLCANIHNNCLEYRPEVAESATNEQKLAGRKLATWDERKGAVLDIIVEANADIFASSEVAWGQQKRDIDAALGGAYERVGKVASASCPANEGNFIWYRKSALVLEGCGKHMLDATYYMIVAKFRTVGSNVPFVFANVHAQDNALTADNLEETLMQYVNDEPVVLAGDLNSKPGEALIEWLKGGRSPYAPATLVFQEPSTWMFGGGWYPVVESTVNRVYPKHIDYILGANGAQVAPVEIVPASTRALPQSVLAPSIDYPLGPYPSDHRAIRTTVSLPAP